MTDALAQWFLHEVEVSGDPAPEIAGVLAQPDPHTAFLVWVESRRAVSLRNDDVTLLMIDL